MEVEVEVEVGGGGGGGGVTDWSLMSAWSLERAQSV